MLVRSLDPERLYLPLKGAHVIADDRITARREPQPKSAPERPEVLATKEDYENDPEGTTVAQDEVKPFVLIDELWRGAVSAVLSSGGGGKHDPR